MRLTIGVATRGNDLYYRLINWLMPYIYSPLGDTRIVLQPSPYSAAHGQEALFKEALNNGSDYLLMVDSDIGPPDNSLEMLLRHNKDIVMAPIWFYDQTHGDIHLNVSPEGRLEMEHRLYEYGTGLQRIHSASFGLMLVKTSALRKFTDAGESFTSWSPLLDESMKKVFSDSLFFAKASKLGVEVYVDWDIRNVIHYRPIELCDKTLHNAVNKISVSVSSDTLNTGTMISRSSDSIAHERAEILKGEPLTSERTDS